MKWRLVLQKGILSLKPCTTFSLKKIANIDFFSALLHPSSRLLYPQSCSRTLLVFYGTPETGVAPGHVILLPRH